MSTPASEPEDLDENAPLVKILYEEAPLVTPPRRRSPAPDARVRFAPEATRTWTPGSDTGAAGEISAAQPGRASAHRTTRRTTATRWRLAGVLALIGGVTALLLAVHFATSTSSGRHTATPAGPTRATHARARAPIPAATQPANRGQRPHRRSAQPASRGRHHRARRHRGHTARHVVVQPASPVPAVAPPITRPPAPRQPPAARASPAPRRAPRTHRAACNFPPC